MNKLSKRRIIIKAIIFLILTWVVNAVAVVVSELVINKVSIHQLDDSNMSLVYAKFADYVHPVEVVIILVTSVGMFHKEIFALANFIVTKIKEKKEL